MDGNSKKTGPHKQNDSKRQPPRQSIIENDETEDGDFATPKRDRGGSDDEPL